METIIGCIITGGLSLVGVVLSNLSNNKKIENTLSTQQAVTDTKIEELTREVREHNNFARRIPVVEEQIKNIDLRLSKLEGRDWYEKNQKNSKIYIKYFNNS